uniref:DNA-directed DNA polymerase n=1 Tax=Romanomermis culicivorax TaxID=13658 RepID=A0A915JQM8_ROMCU
MKANSDDDENCTTQKFESWLNAAQHIHLIDGFDFGPSSISVQKQVTPKLLRLQWNNFPLYYSSKFGWGYLSPKSGVEINDFDHMKESASVLKVLRNSTFYTLKFPLKALLQYILSKPHSCHPEEGRICKMPGFEKLAIDYMKLPHKDGPENNVGNPLAKDFIHFIDQNILSSENAFHAQLLASLTLRCSYWKNNADRIQKLLLVLLPDMMLPDILKSNSKSVGIILPRMVVAGTVTRRAVEPTWMTVSNAKKDRIGSELKAMIQAPDNYCFVGADVDSQELWIAGLLADSSKHKMHGCTPFSFMLLKGTKADGTDQHSVVAKSLGITRDQAKIINYGRFYGAGLNYAARLLQQFKPHESQWKVKSAAINLYKFTKGVRTNKTTQKNRNNNVFPSELIDRNFLWKNGSESDLFNCLESIARSPKPETPVLKCRLSRSLEPDVVGEKVYIFIVDNSGIISIIKSFRESVIYQVRYLVKEEDKYKAALALQISNLLTRSFFVYSVGMRDLPLSVAYFSQVDIDKTIRKESNDDCVTPSNPLGLETCYNIPKGESLNIRQLLSKLEGN